jgi:hypothetical protein
VSSGSVVAGRARGGADLEHLSAGGGVGRVVGDVLPAAPHLGQHLLDAGVAGLPERLLDQLEGPALGGELGEVGVLGVPTALEEDVPDALHVVGTDALADAGGRREERRYGAAADGAEVDPLAGVALGVDVRDVLAGDV